MKRMSAVLGASTLVAAAALAAFSAGPAPARLSPIEELGKRLFFDPSLSTPPGVSCAACHGPDVGFTGPDESLNKAGAVYEGAVKGRFGNRKPPSAAYAGWSPKLHREEESGAFVGGMFWDGRATGHVLGDPLAEQAMGPPLNPLEQNMADAAAVVRAVKASASASLFETVWGPGSLDAAGDANAAYVKIARSIAAYERSAEVNPFSSKFDDFWRAAKAKGLDAAAINVPTASKFAGLGLDAAELKGLVLFATKGLCANCHTLESEGGRPPVLTDYSYDNLGVPANPDNPFYGQDKAFNPAGKAWVDEGLGGYLGTTAEYKPVANLNNGRFKVPTMRNVDLRPNPGFVKAYMHNGFFKSLKDVVHFYNTRDKAGAGWPAPEVGANLSINEMGNLGLTGAEEDAIVAFLATLSDRR
jgi:cytochrome c peroxidase